TYVAGLRRALGPARGALVSRSAGYSLRLAEGALDVDVFERRRAEGQRLFAAGEWAGARAALGEALALWEGVAYEGLSGPYVELERRRLGELRLGAIELRARAALGLGRFTEVITQVRPLVDEHPWYESLRELLMLALHRSGRPAEALEVYRDARDALLADQGLEPGPSLRHLHQVITAETTAPPHQPAAHTPHAADHPTAAHDALAGHHLPAAHDALAGHHPMTGPRVPAGHTPLAGHHLPAAHDALAGHTTLAGHRAPVAQHASALPTHSAETTRPVPAGFVGRTGEIALLRSLVADVRAGRGGAVWVEGDPGIGKSALLALALAGVDGDGARVAWGVADEMGRRFPLHVITECLDGVKASPASGRRGFAGADAAAVEQVVAVVEAICADAPLILVVDDLQWADDSSLLVWHRLVAVTRRLPLLLAAASRPTAGRRDLARLRRGVEARAGHVVALGPLDDADAEDLVAHVVGGRPGPVLRGITRRAAGNPLYLREVAHGLVARGAVRVVDGVADVDPAAGDELPGSLLAAVGRSLDFLSEDARQVLRSAALLGVEFRVGELAAVTGRSVLDLASVLEEAVAGAVVVEAGEELAFRHPYLREALYGAMSAPVRAALHRQAAQALAAAGASVDRVAAHLVAEPVPVDAWVLDWLTAHHAALAARSPGIAADLLGRATDTDPADARQRTTLSTALATLRHAGGLESEQRPRGAAFHHGVHGRRLNRRPVPDRSCHADTATAAFCRATGPDR
ncbi:BTAD domain-containing putative transcriptional regulator, partial [Saccharothrix hoggarensis]